jgi:phosphoribosylaminoimidazolecarboxamide formyltransferase/IMP cyclohydrolase
MAADDAFVPPAQEAREVFGLRLTQDRDTVHLSAATFTNTIGGELPTSAVDDLLLGMAVLRYTQSNSVCYLRAGTTLGIGAGQQSRVDCTRLAAQRLTHGGCDATREFVASRSGRTSPCRTESTGRFGSSKAT